MTHLTSRFMTDDYLKRLPEFCMGQYQCLMEDSCMNVSHESSFDETFLCSDLLRRIRPLEFQQLALHLQKKDMVFQLSFLSPWFSLFGGPTSCPEPR